MSLELKIGASAATQPADRLIHELEESADWVCPELGRTYRCPTGAKYETWAIRCSIDTLRTRERMVDALLQSIRYWYWKRPEMTGPKPEGAAIHQMEPKCLYWRQYPLFGAGDVPGSVTLVCRLTIQPEARSEGQ